MHTHIYIYVNKHIPDRYTYLKTYHMYTAINVTHKYICVSHMHMNTT